jgi:hypothetical protein
VRVLRWLCALAAGVLAVGGVTGCGATDGPGARAAAEQFTRAVADKNGEAACALLAPATREELEESARASCASAILEEDLPDAGALERSATFGTMAQVSFSSSVVFLAEFPRGWRVLAAGCAPGASPGKPYVCQLSGG